MSVIPSPIDVNHVTGSSPASDNALNFKDNGSESPTPDELSGLDGLNADFSALEISAAPSQKRRGTTDLVRLYLQEIGRVPLLSRDEEVAEAQKVQRYMHLLETRSQSLLEQHPTIQTYVQLEEIGDRLTATLGHRPSPKRWASATNLPLPGVETATCHRQTSLGRPSQLTLIRA